VGWGSRRGAKASGRRAAAGVEAAAAGRAAAARRAGRAPPLRHPCRRPARLPRRCGGAAHRTLMAMYIWCLRGRDGEERWAANALSAAAAAPDARASWPLADAAAAAARGERVAGPGVLPRPARPHSHAPRRDRGRRDGAVLAGDLAGGVRKRGGGRRRRRGGRRQRTRQRGRRRCGDAPSSLGTAGFAARPPALPRPTSMAGGGSGRLPGAIWGPRGSRRGL
jgi:hypothetical protein